MHTCNKRSHDRTSLIMLLSPGSGSDGEVFHICMGLCINQVHLSLPLSTPTPTPRISVTPPSFMNSCNFYFISRQMLAVIWGLVYDHVEPVGGAPPWRVSSQVCWVEAAMRRSFTKIQQVEVWTREREGLGRGHDKRCMAKAVAESGRPTCEAGGLWL